MNYTDKLNKLYERRNADVSKSFSCEDSTAYTDQTSERKKAQKYALEAMKELPPESTKTSYEEGDKVKGHLIKGLQEYEFSPKYRYQGSVTCNTHIKHYSDIDLLVIIGKFVTVENPRRVIEPYKGNPIDDLTRLRNICIEILQKSYTVANVQANSKSIKISGGSLRRSIDVVPSNWYNSEQYYRTNKDYFRGIQIFDTKTQQRQTNYPFWNIQLVEQKDNRTQKLYRPLIRLAKTLKADSKKNIDISSYDIQAIFYYMPNEEFLGCYQNQLSLINAAENYLKALLSNYKYFSNLLVPDQTRKISEKVTHKSLQLLQEEFAILARDIV